MAEVIRTISPATNQVVCEVPATTLEETRDIGIRSKDAFHSFKEMPYSERRAIVVKALALIQERKMELGRELSEQMGRPIAYSHKEIETMQKRADYLLDIAEEALAPLPGRPESGFKRCIKKIPRGPTLIVFAWNVSAAHPEFISHADSFGGTWKELTVFSFPTSLSSTHSSRPSSPATVSS